MSKWGRLGIVLCLFLSTEVWASIGKVSLLKGDAAASRENQTVKLENNSPIEEHDKIVTGNNSQIQLTFEDKTVITLGSSSALDIQEYLNDAQQPKAKFKFNQGTFKSITGEIGKKAPDNFNLETKTATIGIRGTTVAGSVGYAGGDNYITLLPDAAGTVGQILVSNGAGSQILNSANTTPAVLPPPPPLVRPDLIGCLSGAIVVTNTHGAVPVSAGSFTIVTPRAAPTPPAPLTPAQLQQLNQAPTPQAQGNQAPAPSTQQTLQAPPTPTITTMVSEIANNTLQQSKQNDIANTATNEINQYNNNFTPSIGLTGGALEDTLFTSSVNNYFKDIDTTLTYGFSYRPHNTDWVTGETTRPSVSTLLLLENIPLVGTNGWNDLSTLDNTLTGFNYLTKTLNSSNTPVTLSINNTSIGLSSYTLLQDTNDELFIASLYSNDIGYAQKFIIGHQSSSIPASSVLYYQDPFDAISNISYTELTGSNTALAINTENKKALGISVDGTSNEVYITIGSINNHNSLSLKDYSIMTADNGNYITHSSYASLLGAVYGSNNQAIGVNGRETDYSYNSDYRTYGTSYDVTTGVAVKTTTSTSSASQQYNTSQTLEGTITNLQGNSDLTIQINKNTGTVSVSSSVLSIDGTSSSSQSAYIHDDYFAAISTATYNDTTPILTKYLIAIPLGTQDDYVSWGYWGKNTLDGTNQITTGTSPFSTWVAGVKTDASVIQSLVSNTASYNYSGTVIGAARDGGVWGSIKNDGANYINLSINFNTANPITGIIAFNTSNNASWSSDITTSTLTAGSSSFTANLSSTNSYGSLKGNFYGPTANAIAGSFSLSKLSDDTAYGSFKAKRP